MVDHGRRRENGGGADQAADAVVRFIQFLFIIVFGSLQFCVAFLVALGHRIQAGIADPRVQASVVETRVWLRVFSEFAMDHLRNGVLTNTNHTLS